MEEYVFRQECGGGGADDVPPYVGVCKICNGACELPVGEYERRKLRAEVFDILQANTDTANGYLQKAAFMEVKSEDDYTEQVGLQEDAHFLTTTVVQWFLDYLEDDIEEAVGQVKAHGYNLKDAWMAAHEPNE